MQQVPLEKTLNVRAVEQQLIELWQRTAGDDLREDRALLRARVANLLVFVSTEPMLDEVLDLIPELTRVHPSRALLMWGARESADRDIEMFVTTHCTQDTRTSPKRLCCEQILLKARGYFVDELPSAALPLIVSDLSTFLWWRSDLKSGPLFKSLLEAADRLIIDSADFADTKGELAHVHKLFQSSVAIGISDINWARLTFWRGLLGDFYDVPAYESSLDQIEQVRIDYVAPARESTAIAPQALLFAGWLISRLDWQVVRVVEQSSTALLIELSSSKASIKLNLNRVDARQVTPGKLMTVELQSSANDGSTFTVARSADNLHLFTEARVGSTTERGRVLPVRNRSTAQLISREMEILCNDQIYQEAISEAIKIQRAIAQPGN